MCRGFVRGARYGAPVIKTGFPWLDSGEITWSVLLNGSVGVVGAVAAAGLAFWLQARHARLVSLREAVETYREHLSSIAAEWMSGRGSP